MKKILSLFFIAGLVGIAGCSSDDGPSGPDRSQNRLKTGTSGVEILVTTPYNELILDIAYVEGFKPSSTAIDNLITFLQTRTHKTNITTAWSVVPSPGIAQYNVEGDMLQVENNLRALYNEGSTQSVFLFFADGESDENEGNSVTLGAAYFNTSIIIFEKTLQELANKSTSISLVDVETATLQHEFGHLFGLTNLGTPMLVNHEDSLNAGHCNVSGCLMSAEIQFGSGVTGRLLSGKGLPLLDPLCINDIQAIGGK